MAFGTTLREHHTMAASVNMFYIAIGYIRINQIWK